MISANCIHPLRKKPRYYRAIHNNLISYACLSIDIDGFFGKWQIIMVASITAYDPNYDFVDIFPKYYSNYLKIVHCK